LIPKLLLVRREAPSIKIPLLAPPENPTFHRTTESVSTDAMAPRQHKKEKVLILLFIFFLLEAGLDSPTGPRVGLI